MNNLQIFKDSEFGAVRVVEIDNEPWFVAKDISDALEYRMPSDMVRNLDGYEKGTHKVQTSSGIQDMLIINESGLYSAILTSRKQEAKKFKKWVTSEVLPSIRKTGEYKLQQNTIKALNSTISEMQTTISEYKTMCKINCSKKTKFINYIKNRLGIPKADKEFDDVKTRLFLILDVEKWEDIEFDNSDRILHIIDESIRVIKSERPYKQLSFNEW